MELKQWIWNNHLTIHGFARKYDMSYQTVLATTKNITTPRLGTALFIVKLTKGEVTLESMMSEKEAKSYTDKLTAFSLDAE